MIVNVFVRLMFTTVVLVVVFFAVLALFVLAGALEKVWTT
jgi:hypothetical protein